MSDDEIVGHKTFSDGHSGFRHEPLTRKEADALHQRIEERTAKRAADMPTEQDAINALFDAWQRLKELGWNDARYAKAGIHKIIEIGSTGIHTASKDTGLDGWWIEHEGDLWPSRPVMFKASPSKGASDA